MTDIIKTEKQELTNTEPRGFEQTGSEDLIIPRAKKLEQNSPEVIEEGSELKSGQIINSITKEILPEIFTPIIATKSWIRFNPRKKEERGFDPSFGPGDMIYKTTNPNDPRLKEDSKWEGDNPPLATAFLNFLSVFEGSDFPVVVSFCNTSYKAGKTLLSIAKFAGGDIFSKSYKLTTKRVQNDQGVYHLLNVQMAKNTDEETLSKCIAIYNSFKGKELKTDESDNLPF